MKSPADPLAIEICYRPLGGNERLTRWITLPPVDGVAQLERGRELARILREGGRVVTMLLDGKPVK